MQILPEDREGDPAYLAGATDIREPYDDPAAPFDATKFFEPLSKGDQATYDKFSSSIKPSPWED